MPACSVVAANISDGYIRHVNRGGNLMSGKLTDQAIYKIVTGYARKIENSSPATEETNENCMKQKSKNRLIAPAICAARLGNSPIRAARLSNRFNSPYDMIRFRRL